MLVGSVGSVLLLLLRSRGDSLRFRCRSLFSLRPPGQSSIDTQRRWLLFTRLFLRPSHIYTYMQRHIAPTYHERILFSRRGPIVSCSRRRQPRSVCYCCCLFVCALCSFFGVLFGVVFRIYRCATITHTFFFTCVFLVGVPQITKSNKARWGLGPRLFVKTPS